MALACFSLGKNPVVSCLAIASIRTFIVKPQTAELAICAQGQPPDEATEVVAGGSEDGIGGVAGAVPEIVAAHSVLGFEIADDRLDGGTSAQLALDRRRHPPLLA